MYRNLLKTALLKAAGKNGINFADAIKFIKIFGDGRFTIRVNALTCSWYFNQSGLIVYRGTKYYFVQHVDGIELEIA